MKCAFAGELNLLVTNGLYHRYHLDESTSIFRGIRSKFVFHFSMKITSANRKASDERPRFAASHLVLFCLPMSQKRTPGLYGLNGNRNGRGSAAPLTYYIL